MAKEHPDGHYGFYYDKDTWREFKRICWEQHAMRVSTAMAHLIDYVVRNKQLPGVRPLLQGPTATGGDYHPDAFKLQPGGEPDEIDENAGNIAPGHERSDTSARKRDALPNENTARTKGMDR